jgi:glucose/arabinose dehydrogenase
MQALPTSAPQPWASPTAPASTQTSPPPTAVVEFPNPDAFEWHQVANGLENPIGLANAGDGSGRLFILEQAGRIRILHNGSLLPEPFLDVSDRISCCGERGLLGLAFHPRYAENGYFYVNYTDTNGNTVIARFQAANPQDGRADPSSEMAMLNIEQPYRNHNGGAVVFGPDGYLYLGLGDGGSAGDPLNAGQSTNTLLGKVLRIDVDAAQPYAAPPDNPFSSGGGLAEIWAYGLRNPWRISFDRLTGDLYIADVGQNSLEEINFLPAGSPGGANFGWNFREGSQPYQGNPPAGLAMLDPVADYNHTKGCSVTGGYVYRGANLPQWQGIYLYGDYCTGLVWGLLNTPQGWRHAELYQTNFNITSFGEDEAGEVYLVDYGGGIYRLSARP